MTMTAEPNAGSTPGPGSPGSAGSDASDGSSAASDPTDAAPQSELVADAGEPELRVRDRLDPRRTGLMIALWGVVVLVCIGGVLYGLEPLFTQREQAQLLESYRADVQRAANESLTIGGATTPTKAPELGAAVGIVEIGGIQLQQVAVEGATPSETATGLAHVPGTAGLGQAGNAVVVGRRSAFGGPFSSLDAVHVGDEILVTTRQGQTVYVVDRVGEHVIEDTPPASSSNDVYADASADANADPLSKTAVRSEDLYGRTGRTQLTLLTSAAAAPWNQTATTVVTAKVKGKPFTSTPQNGRTDSQTGRGSDPSAWAPMLLAVLFFEVTVVAAIYLYRSSSRRVAYLLTAAPLLVAIVLSAETLSRLLPAWY